MKFDYTKIEGQQSSYLVSCEDGVTRIIGIDPARTDIECALQEVLDTPIIDNVVPTPTYRELRSMAYPSISDQLDILYHEGYDGWKASIQAIKDEFPKTE